MPVHLVKVTSKRGFAEDMRGKRYSKRTLPIATARAQVAAINLSEMRRKEARQT